MATVPTFDDWLDQRSTVYMRAPLSGGWFGVTLAVTGNQAIESWIVASRMHLLDDPQSPDDVLPVLARDRKLPRYPLETADQHRARLTDAWEIYELAGTEWVIETQLLAASYGPANLVGTWGNPNITWGDPTYAWGDRGAFVDFRPDREGPRGEAAPYRTQFWVTFATGFHPVTGLPKPWGTFTWGDTWPNAPGVWAPTGLTPQFYATVLGIVLKWKPSQYAFRGFSFMLAAVTWGDPTVTWGDPALVWGGSIDSDIALGATLQ